MPLDSVLHIQSGERTTLKAQLANSDKNGLIIFVYPDPSTDDGKSVLLFPGVPYLREVTNQIKIAVEYAGEFEYGILNYERIEMTMVGLSPTSVSANAKLSTRSNLPFNYLSDAQKKLLKAVGLDHLSKSDKKKACRCLSGRQARELAYS